MNEQEAQLIQRRLVSDRQVVRHTDKHRAMAHWKGKEEYLYSAYWPRWYTQSAQAWITQFYLQITPYLPFLREHSPDVTTTATEAADIQLQLTTNLSTPKG